MAFRNYFPPCPAVVGGVEVKEKTLQKIVDDNGLEIVTVVDSPISHDLPDYSTSSIDVLQSAGVVPEKVSPYILEPTISISESENSNV